MFVMGKQHKVQLPGERVLGVALRLGFARFDIVPYLKPKTRIRFIGKQSARSVQEDQVAIST